MPEGDTVFRTAARLDLALSGATVVASDLRVPRHATADLRGSEVVATLPRGKHLLTRLRLADGAEVTLHSHLKMEGSWRLHRPGARWERPAHTARVVLRVEGSRGAIEAVGFSLGMVDLVATADEHRLVGHLGPDLLDPAWGPDLLDVALMLLVQRPERPLRSALLDQTNLAGIGNVYAAELCFGARLHPETPVAEVPDLSSLVLDAHRLLHLNRGRSKRITTGDRRAPLWVYGRDGRPCRRCGTPVRSSSSGDVAGQERVSYWCPTCQPDQTG